MLIYSNVLTSLPIRLIGTVSAVDHWFHPKELEVLEEVLPTVYEVRIKRLLNDPVVLKSSEVLSSFPFCFFFSVEKVVMYF